MPKNSELKRVENAIEAEIKRHTGYLNEQIENKQYHEVSETNSAINTLQFVLKCLIPQTKLIKTKLNSLLVLLLCSVALRDVLEAAYVWGDLYVF